MSKVGSDATEKRNREKSINQVNKGEVTSWRQDRSLNSHLCKLTYLCTAVFCIVIDQFSATNCSRTFSRN